MHFDPMFFVAFPAFVLSLVIHECGHGWVALWNGDPSARDAGCLTLDPLPHIDLVGSLLVPGLLFVCGAPVPWGWAKPIPIDRGRLRDPRNGTVAVALAGPGANILLAIAFAGLARVTPGNGVGLPLRTLGYSGVLWNCALSLFNLIPIPPLDGSWVLMRFLRLRHILALHRFRHAALLVVLAATAWPVSWRLLFRPPLDAAVRACLALVGLATSGKTS